MTPPVVYDTMLFFQAATQPARMRASIEAVRTGQALLCLSNELIAEIRGVLFRPEYQARFPSLQPAAVETFIAEMLAAGRLFEPIPKAFTWPQHPDDDHLFNLAIVSGASFLVTWESRILKLGTDTTPAANALRQVAPSLSIVSPPDFSAALKRMSGPGREP